MRGPVLVVAVALLGSVACSDGGTPSSDSATTTRRPASSSTAEPAPLTVVAVGDIATCDGTDDEAVAELVGTLRGDVLLLGDIAYPNGTPEQFEECFEPAWGNLRDRLRPAPGNHDFHTEDGAGYFGWFGEAAGEPGKGWYSFDVGPWHVLALNSNCAAVGGCGAGAEQERWLREALAASKARCTLAFWHHARFSSGSVHGSDATTADLWRALADAGADVVLAGHEHVYERFAPMDAGGRVDPGRGIRSFVVGTGGRSHYGFGVPRAGSEVRDATTFGVLELTLSEDRYRWRFVPVPGDTFTDKGQGRCH
ncbi:MAG TPA: metallophosphoesterase [Acidimicrobiales bacterium]|nr:metallophosphoesterase [Acidimicrobiales bacterium]